VTGTLFRTKTGEPSLKLESFTILSKALRPPPAKWHGLEDTEIRYRQRYLDLIGNPEVKDVFLKRSAIVHEIRSFFHSRGYVEVETPAMQAIPGGAAAQPFKTFPQRARLRILSAHRAGALPQAPARGRH
jgi:lysyl-tRNA synthetase class 2